MAAITVKNIPEDLYEMIRQSAAIHRRSINNEIIFRLQQTLLPQKVEPEELIARIEAIHEGLNLPPLTDAFLRKAKAKGRP